MSGTHVAAFNKGLESNNASEQRYDKLRGGPTPVRAHLSMWVGIQPVVCGGLEQAQVGVKTFLHHSLQKPGEAKNKRCVKHGMPSLARATACQWQTAFFGKATAALTP
jgi:hypothetical protein